MPSRPQVHRPTPATPQQARLSRSRRGYTAAWYRARSAYLREHPLCVECERDGIVEPAIDLDHIIPHRGDEGLFWLESNWAGLCKKHHGEKTRRGE